ncbi:RibD family protein [Rhodovulum sp. DZ06]|uniref:RibD family protein n=1 Tax=Rhodovulum sp. DZ06 TaxID=3425126 RepID=UPI003D3476B0
MNQVVPDFGPPELPVTGEGETFVVAQLGQSLDGRIATVTGASKYINGRRALDHLHALRAQVDAVLVGVGTVEADDPQLTVRRCAGDSPVRVVLDPSGRAPCGARMFADGAAPVLAVVREGVAGPAGAETLELPCGPNGFAPADIVAALAARGLRRILVEGGAETLARFIDAGAVDMLHVLVAPMILGSGKPGFRLAPIETLDEAMRPRARVHLFDDGDVLFACDLRAARAASAA